MQAELTPEQQDAEPRGCVRLDDAPQPQGQHDASEARDAVAIRFAEQAERWDRREP